MVVSFGTMFNNIRMVRYNKAGTTEIERIIVPLQYGQKEKFFQRITQDPELTREVEITLPRMSFELTSINYDPLRKTSTFNRQFNPGSSSNTLRSVRSSPYDFDFTLSVYVRNTEDGTQIIEQILPYFSPDYTVTVDPIGLNNPIDLPIVLNSINYDVQDATGSPESLRIIVWTLSFTIKGYFFGPVNNVSVIRTSTANIYNDVYTSAGARKIFVGDGNGTFKIGELVYEGATLSSANATAYVDLWSPSTNSLFVIETNGVLQTGRTITGAISNAAYNIVSFGTNDQQLVQINVTPNPNTANANSAYGFDESIFEFPDIL